MLNILCSSPQNHIHLGRAQLTVYARLERLPTHLTRQVPYANLLFEFDRDRVLVVAEEALEVRRERVALHQCQCLVTRQAYDQCEETHTFFGPWGLEAFFRFPWTVVS